MLTRVTKALENIDIRSRSFAIGLITILSLELPTGALGQTLLSTNDPKSISQARDAIKEAVQIASTITETRRKDFVLGLIGKAQARAHDLAGAANTAQLIDDKLYRERIVSAIAIMRLKTGDVAGAMATVGQSDYALYFVAMEQIEGGNLEMGWRFAAPISDRNTKHIALTKLIKARVKDGDLKEATAIAMNVEDWPYKGDAWSAISIAQAQNGNLNAALDSASKLGSYKRDLIRQISAVIAKQGNAAKALEIALEEPLSELAALGKTTAEMRAHARSRGEAEEIDAVMADVALLNRAQTQACAGDARSALESIAGVKRLHTPDLAHFIALIAAARAEAGAISEAMEITVFVIDEHRKIQALEKIAIAQANAGKVEEALKTASTISEIDAREESLRQIARIQAELGDVAGALNTAVSIQGEARKERALVDIGIVQARGRDFAAAAQTAARTKTASSRAQVMQSIAQKQLEAGNWKAALETLLPYRAVTGSAEILRSISVAQARTRDIEGARKTASLIHDAILPRHRPEAFQDIAVLQVETGDPIGAMEKTVALQPEVWKPSTVRHISDAWAKNGDVEGARRWAAAQSPVFKSMALLGIAEGILERLGVPLLKDYYFNL